MCSWCSAPPWKYICSTYPPQLSSPFSIVSSFPHLCVPLTFGCLLPYNCCHLRSFPCSHVPVLNIPWHLSWPIPLRNLSEKQIEAKHFNWIKIVFLHFLQLWQCGFYWKLSMLHKSLQGHAPPISGAAPLQQRQGILCHVQTSGCSAGLPPSSLKTTLPSPEGLSAFSLVHVPQCAKWALQPHCVLEQFVVPGGNVWLSGAVLSLCRGHEQRKFSPQLQEPLVWHQAGGRNVGAGVRGRIRLWAFSSDAVLGLCWVDHDTTHPSFHQLWEWQMLGAVG